MTKILIVDDDEELRENLTEILGDAGFATDTASSGREALDKIETDTFKVVLLDFMMPGMRGDVALTEFRRRAPHTKIIMITAFATVESAVDAIKNGASDYIAKPFKVEELVMSVRRALEEASFESKLKKLDLDFTLSALSNSIRRKIMHLIGTVKKMRLMEITRELHIEDHTKVVFHLKILKGAGLLGQQEDKTYFLTPEGEKILGCLNTLESYLLM